MKTPVSLLERLKNPTDQDSWSRLVQLYLPFICYWGRHWGLQAADVHDLCQEVFALLVRKLPEFAYDPRKGFRNWLRTITLNKLRELRRKRVPVPDQTALERIDDTLEEAWEAEHDRYLAARALKLMQTDYDTTTWQACWEMVVEDKPAAAVARKLGMSVGAVYAAKSRILRRLRNELCGLR